MIILVGASASGKTEICKALCFNYQYKKFVTTTTRKMRIGEIQGVDYNFISEETFLNYIKDDKFIEYVNYNNNYYGTEKKNISLTSVLIVEPNGLESFNDLKDETLVSFLLKSDKNKRKERMLSRGDDPKIVEERLIFDEKAFSNIKKVTFEIDSDSYTIEELANLIHSLYIKKLEELNIKLGS